MKIGDLVVAKPNHPDEGEMGMIIGFDKDNDPIVFWQFKILLKRVESDFGVSPHWEVLMQDTGRVERVLVLNLANGRNSRYEII